MDVQEDGQDGQVNDSEISVGMPNDDSGESSEATATGSQAQDPLYVQKRLKQQKRAHEREIRELHQRISDMQSMGNGQAPQQQSQPQMPMNNYSQPQGMQPPMGGGINDVVHQAVSEALSRREMAERQAKDAESKAHIGKQYDDLQRHLDKTADKYDDFDDVVRGNNTPFTSHMRDAALFLPKVGPGAAGEVFYKLGKNPDELSRIARLHPIDQASEMVKLSQAMANDKEAKNSLSSPSLGNIKSNPVMNATGVVNEKTPIGDLRRRMRAGWK